MKCFNQAVSTLFVTLSLIAAPAILQAEDLINQSSSVFKFQHTLAENGNVHAQYKLATMYELGDGVNADLEQARNWYTRAASAGSAPASQRLTYLEVKQQGYKPSQHKQWLESVRKDAAAHDPDSTYLLAQLYSQGIGVNKDLHKSLELYDTVAILGSADVEEEIADVQLQIAKAREARLSKKNEQEQARQLAAKQAQEKARQKTEANSQQQKINQAQAEKLALEEKRRRYEAVMLKLKQEQQLIDQQQAKITGKEVATIDDEF